MITVECECPETKIKVISEVEKAPLMLSKVIAMMFEDLDGDISKVVIPIMVNARVLTEVIKYCKQALIDPPNITPPEYLHVNVHQWEKDFFTGYNDRMLFDIVSAANVLDIGSLYDASAMFIGLKFKNMTPDEIRTQYNITRVFTPEEEEALLITYDKIVQDKFTESRNMPYNDTTN